MTNRFSRRHLFAIGVGFVASLAANHDRQSKAAVQQSDDAMRIMDNCFWDRTDVYLCDNGTLKQLWCYVCCGGLECEEWWCEWRVVGSC